jgi:hypothetical protein
MAKAIALWVRDVVRKIGHREQTFFYSGTIYSGYIDLAMGGYGVG